MRENQTFCTSKWLRPITKIKSLIFISAVILLGISSTHYTHLTHHLHRRTQDGSLRTYTQYAQLITFTLNGVEPRIPNVSEYSFFESNLFFFLNTALITKGLQTSDLYVLQHATELTSSSSSTSSNTNNASAGLVVGTPVDIDVSWSTDKNPQGPPVFRSSSAQSTSLRMDVLIKGKYISPPLLDHASIIVEAINMKRNELVQRLVITPSPSNDRLYFKSVTSISASVDTTTSTTTTSSSSNTFPSLVEDEDGDRVNQVSNNPYGTTTTTSTYPSIQEPSSSTDGESINQVSSSSTNQDSVNTIYYFDNNLPSTNTDTTPSNDELDALGNTIKSYHYTRSINHNSRAIYYRTLSGCFFFLLLSTLILWNLYVCLKKQNLYRKERIIAAKEAFDAPKQLRDSYIMGSTHASNGSSGGSRNFSSMHRSRDGYSGHLDTHDLPNF